jgi:serine/threonine protein kinase
MTTCCLALSKETLQRLADNDLAPDELRDVEQHVDHCPECRALFDRQISADSMDSEIIVSLGTTIESIPSVATDEFLDLGPSTASLLRLLGPTDDPNMLGRVGNYEVAGIVGRGGMGVVFKAFDRSLHRFVAIKMLLPHLAESAAARKRFAREAKAAAAVVDDHVMPIHGVAEWNGMPYIVSPYCRGVTLEKRIRDQGPLAVEEVLRIGMQTALGLAAAHEQGLVHRDIKPANILLDEGVERVQLTDFGLARTTDDIGMTRTGILAGTPQFMSPEQTRGEALDARSDLFALGSVLYTMCVGQPPFRGANPLAVMQKIANDRAPAVQSLNPTIPPPLSRLIERLMEKRPSQRIPSATEAADQLRELLASRQRGGLPAGQTGSVLRVWHVASLSAVCFIAAMGFYAPWKLASTPTPPPNEALASSPKINEVGPDSTATASASANWAAGWGVERGDLDEVWGRVRALENRNDSDNSNNDDTFRRAIDQLRRDLEQVDRRFDQWSQ